MMVKCPICEKGKLKKTKIKETMFGVYLGEFPADVCSSCNESFTDQQTTHDIQEAAKKKGIWGLGIKTKITDKIFFDIGLSGQSDFLSSYKNYLNKIESDKRLLSITFNKML